MRLEIRENQTVYLYYGFTDTDREIMALYLTMIRSVRGMPDRDKVKMFLIRALRHKFNMGLEDANTVVEECWKPATGE